jgi:hypothetical protein
MNKERYNQIVDEVYKNYVDKLSYNENDCFADEDINKPNKTFIPYNQEEFINKIKTDKEFSERWGLKIEEQELSHDERIILMNKKLGVTDTLPQYYNTDDEMDKNNVSTKVITVTYNNEIIKIYDND